jgi:hypothetical protein
VAPGAVAGPAAADAGPPARAGSSVLAADGKKDISFGIRTANATNVDNRGLWDYKDQVPGRTFIDHVGVVNLAETPITLDVYPADLFNNADGAVDVVPPSQKSTDLGSWITLAKKKVTVPARSTVIMGFAVKIPANAQPGDHSASIVASYLTKGKDAKGNLVNVDNRTGQRIYLRVRGPLKPGLAVEGLTAGFRQSNPLGSGTSDIKFSVHNTGNVRVSGTPNAKIDGFFTDSAVTGLQKIPELLPGNSITVGGQAKGLFPLDYDDAKVRLDPKSTVSEADPQFQSISMAVSFWAVSWLLLLLIVLLIAAIAGSAYLYLRRRRRGQGGEPQDYYTVYDDDPTFEAPALEVDDDRRTVVTERRSSVVRAVRLVTALGVALVSVGLGISSPAHADSGDGTLTFLPAKGAATTPMYVVTSAPCPLQATAYLGYIAGGNFPKDTFAIGIDVSGTVIRHDAPFGTPVSNLLPLLAAQRGVQLVPGEYMISLICTDTDGVANYRSFNGKITLDRDLSYSGSAPAMPPAHGVPLSILSSSFPQVQASLAAQAAGSPAPSAAGGSATPGASGAASGGQGVVPGAAAPSSGGAAPGGGSAGVLGGPQESEPLNVGPASDAQKSSGKGTDPVTILLGVGVVIIAGLAGLRWYASRDRQITPPAAHESVDWSEVDEASATSGAGGHDGH